MSASAAVLLLGLQQLLTINKNNRVFDKSTSALPVQLDRLKESNEASIKSLQDVRKSLEEYEQVQRARGIVQYKEGLSPADREALDRAVKIQQDMDKRLSALEATILETPEKAVALPLIRQQLSDMEGSNKQDVDAVHGEISRLSTIMVWCFGAMVTLLVATGALLYNVFKHQTDAARRSSLPSPASPPS
jgi:hypothetical protein